MNENGLKLFVSEDKELYLFELNGKPATLAPELLKFEGYKNFRKTWQDIKEKEDFEEQYEYITLKGDDLKEFKDNVLKIDDRHEVVPKTYTTLYEKYKSVPSIDIVLEEGIYGVMNYSNSGNAKRFKKFIRRDVNPQIRKDGRYDIKETELMKIENETERMLRLKIKKLEEMLEIDKSDLFIISQLNSCKLELNQHLNYKQIEEVNTKVNEINQRLAKTTVLREGDLSPEAIAKKFNIFSLSDKPHILFAENLARDLGIYLSPQGNSGYQDEYISINLTDKGGKTVPEVKYSQAAYDLMVNHVEENGLKLGEPSYYKKGKNKGDYKSAQLMFLNERKININEITYNLYK
ncbi:hypothetical protein EH2_00248 [Bacillus subtilis]|uniref:hypothetical protein n=1 Tax=Bacillus subtilis TaxID=1423 RepID=UPI000F5355B0|nr:hypothetical protein [Bacillus subtilis]MED4875858.1 hypothetical protein [Bacillus subtilis]RPK20955.1 hypothetical protein EH2_00248 [Bacillus subtilis]